MTVDPSDTQPAQPDDLQPPATSAAVQEELAGASAPPPMEREPETVGEPAPEAPPRSSVLTPVRMLLALTVLLALVSILFGLMVFAPQLAPLKVASTRAAIEDRTEAQIEDVAERFARNYVSIDHRTIDADFARARRDATGSLRSQLSRIPDILRESYSNARSIQEARSAEAQVTSLSGDTASVVVVLRFAFTNSERTEPQTRSASIQMTLVRTADGWKVADATQQGTAGPGPADGA